VSELVIVNHFDDRNVFTARYELNIYLHFGLILVLSGLLIQHVAAHHIYISVSAAIQLTAKCPRPLHSVTYVYRIFYKHENCRPVFYKQANCRPVFYKHAKCRLVFYKDTNCRPVFYKHANCRLVFYKDTNCRPVFYKHANCRFVFYKIMQTADLYSINKQIAGLYSIKTQTSGLNFKDIKTITGLQIFTKLRHIECQSRLQNWHAYSTVTTGDNNWYSGWLQMTQYLYKC
jgi:hypothetical protein